MVCELHNSLEIKLYASVFDINQGNKYVSCIEDRPIESVREEVIDQLIMNYSHGKLSHEAFERRLDKAIECQCNKEIVALVEDLELTVDKNYVEEKKKDEEKEKYKEAKKKENRGLCSKIKKEVVDSKKGEGKGSSK